MTWCEECETCPYHPDNKDNVRIVKPVESSYIDNLMNIARHYSGEATWDFYRKPWKEIKDLAFDDWNERLSPRGPYKNERTARNAEYLTTPEMKVVVGARFCIKKDNAYRILKHRIEGYVAEAEESETPVKVSLDDEYTRIKDYLTDMGYGRSDILEMMRGFRQAASVVARILIMSVKGASEVLSISSCTISDYFPETRRFETMQIAESSAV